MNQKPRRRILFWHKLLIALAGAMMILAVGLTFTAMSSIRRASTELGIKSRQILTEQTERFLTNIIDGQSDTVDLQLDMARVAAIHGATSLQNLLKLDMTPGADFFAHQLANAGGHSRTVFFANLGDNRLVYYPTKEREEALDAVHYSSLNGHFPDFPATQPAATPTRWSNIHRNPYSAPYERVVDALAPVYQDGKLKGYYGVSVSVIRLVSQFNDRQTIRGSYTFLIDGHHGLVSGPPQATFELAPKESSMSDRSVLDLSGTSNQALKTVLDDMVLGNSDVQNVVLNGRSKYLAYRPLTRADWSLGLAVPVALATVASEEMVQVIESKGREALSRMLLTALIMLGIVLVAVGLITRRLTRPLLEMADAVDHIASGHLDSPLAITGTDEVGDLAHAFNDMARQLKTHINSIQRQKHELFESESRYRALFENSPISLWEEDFSRVKRYLDDLRNKGIHQFDAYLTDHPEKVLECAKMIRIIDINESTMKLYGAQSKSKLLGSLPRVLPEDAMAVLKEELVAIAEGRMFEIQCHNTTLDGRTLTIELRSLVPPGYETTWKKVFVAVIDVTDRARAEKENKLLEEQLRQAYKMEAIGTLAGGIAHDFNNILSAILGYTELINSNPDLSEKNQRYSRQVLKAALRAKDLVNQILAFSRQTEQVPTPVPVKQVVNETLKLLRASLPSTIEIQQELSSNGVVMADATRIHQVLMNLCTNAGQAMQESGGVLTVGLDEVDIEQEENLGAVELPAGTYLKLRIQDTGLGMAEATQKRIFDPFFTTKSRDQGTGMGLAVVHGIVQGYNGHIRVESAPSRGSSFMVYLPLAHTSVAPNEQGGNATFPGGDESILLVDDEDALADLGKVMLESIGYQVTAHTDSRDALDAIEKSPYGFDLVITDMTMPNMTGDVLAQSIYQINAVIPVILSSGFSERLNDLKSQTNIRGLLTKPLNMADLANTVRSVLDNSKADKAN